MGASVFRKPASDVGSMVETWTVPVGKSYRLLSVTVTLSKAATTSENLTAVLEPSWGSAYNETMWSVDPSVSGGTSFAYTPDSPRLLFGGDVLKVAYANTDVGTWTLLVVMEAR